MATILILEDDASVRRLMVTVCRRQGYEVLAYADAQPALESIDFSRIDLIITDFRMPTRGDVAVQTIQKMGFDLPVIVVSGYLSEEQIRCLESLGVRKILLKPFGLTELLDEIRGVTRSPFEYLQPCMCA